MKKPRKARPEKRTRKRRKTVAPQAMDTPTMVGAKDGPTAYPQSTLLEIIESERAMVLDGEARYGQLYKHARNATIYLTLFVAGVERDCSDTFGRFYSLIKKHTMLAFLSSLRLHNVQAMMNLRQVLEAGAAAAYAIANPNVEDFVDIDEFGIMDTSKDLARKKRYRWLAENFPEASAWIKEQKDQINAQSSHANMLNGDRTFRVVENGEGASNPFFDIEDEYFVSVDLWRVGVIAIALMDLFFRVAESVASSGRSVLGFREGFRQTFGSIAAENKALWDEVTSSERHWAVMKKIEERGRASR